MQRRGQGSEAVADNHKTERLGMKYAATISVDGHSIIAVIPKGVQNYRFLFVDSNNFLHHSEVQRVE